MLSIFLKDRDIKRKRRERNSFKKIQIKARIAELERMLQSVETIKKSSARNNVQSSFTLPHINLSIKHDDSKVDETKELAGKIFSIDISKIHEVNTQDQSKLKKEQTRKTNFWKGNFML